jgi:DNA-binding MarR family transcriptional regulator
VPVTRRPLEPPSESTGGTSGEQHPRLRLNEAIHQPVRLSIVALLATAQKVDFVFLRDHLALKDANLSQHLSALESLGYVTTDKTFERKRPRTWVSLSPDGRAAFEEYLDVLRTIVGSPLTPPDG